MARGGWLTPQVEDLEAKLKSASEEKDKTREDDDGTSSSSSDSDSSNEGGKRGVRPRRKQGKGHRRRRRRGRRASVSSVEAGGDPANARHLASARFPFELMGRERHERGFVSKVIPAAPGSEHAFNPNCAFAHMVGWLRNGGTAPRRRLGSDAGESALRRQQLAHDLDATQPVLVAVRRTIADMLAAKRVADQVGNCRPAVL